MLAEAQAKALFSPVQSLARFNFERFKGAEYGGVQIVKVVAHRRPGALCKVLYPSPFKTAQHKTSSVGERMEHTWFNGFCAKHGVRTRCQHGFYLLSEEVFVRLNERHPLFGFLNLDLGFSDRLFMIKGTRQRQHRAVFKSSGESVQGQGGVENQPVDQTGIKHVAHGSFRHADVFMVNVVLRSNGS